MNKTLALKPVQVTPRSLFTVIVQRPSLPRLWTNKVLPRVRQVDIYTLILRIHQHLVNLPVRAESQSVPHDEIYRGFLHENVSFGLPKFNHSTQIVIEPLEEIKKMLAQGYTRGGDWITPGKAELKATGTVRETKELVDERTTQTGANPVPRTVTEPEILSRTAQSAGQLDLEPTAGHPASATENRAASGTCQMGTGQECAG